jgi:hypothetical protein
VLGEVKATVLGPVVYVDAVHAAKVCEPNIQWWATGMGGVSFRAVMRGKYCAVAAMTEINLLKMASAVQNRCIEKVLHLLDNLHNLMPPSLTWAKSPSPKRRLVDWARADGGYVATNRGALE